jgi:hypothetical protein
MSRLNPEQLHVSFNGVIPDIFCLPRRYTLTHSDKTGDLYLTIGSDFNHNQTSGLYTRFMRDEVLAEWKTQQGAFALLVNCHVCGGLVFGTASMRESIFRRELPLVLEAIAFGDRELLLRKPELCQSEIIIRFQRSKPEECTIESWGHVGDFSPR